MLVSICLLKTLYPNINITLGLEYCPDVLEKIYTAYVQ
jgi:hypothetical protein